MGDVELKIRPIQSKPGEDPRIDAARWMREQHEAHLRRCREYEKWAPVEAIGIMAAAVFFGLIGGIVLFWR